MPVCLVLVAAAAVASLAREHSTRTLAGFRAIGPGAQLAALTLAMSMSWFALVSLSHAFGLELPFVRTAVPALWVAVVAVVAAFPDGKAPGTSPSLCSYRGSCRARCSGREPLRDGDWKQVAQTSRNDVLLGIDAGGHSRPPLDRRRSHRVLGLRQLGVQSRRTPPRALRLQRRRQERSQIQFGLCSRISSTACAVPGPRLPQRQARGRPLSLTIESQSVGSRRSLRVS